MFKLKEDIVFSTHNDGSTVIISLLDSENCYYKIDGIAQKVFAAISANFALEPLREELLKAYNVDAEQLNRDIDKFISFLKTNNIIEEQ